MIPMTGTPGDEVQVRRMPRVVAAAILAVSLLRPVGVTPQTRRAADTLAMRISRRAERPTQSGPVASFTGTVHVTPLVDATPSSRVSGASVTFEPGARSVWHTHPRGQVSDAEYTTPPARGTSDMPDDSTPKRGPYADIAPALDDFTQQVLFGQVWERPGLSKRDRSLITVATLVANYRTNELPFHLTRALENGVTKDELTELITHLAFYAGWPTANSAIEIARKVFAEWPK